MGIGINELNFLIYIKNKKQLGNVLTIGRQEIHLEKSRVVSALTKMERGNPYIHNQYCEDMLRDNFGAISVESIDNSNYENATHVFDLNKIIDNKILKEYDTIIDFGCTEHIYNISNALENITNLCKIEGQILHIVPANNMCGHGFWQFSPELFLSLYSIKNGYKNTEIYLNNDSDFKIWYKVKEPEKGERINIKSTTKSNLYIIVKTIKSVKTINDKNIQQSDYVELWKKIKSDENNNKKNKYLKEYIKKSKHMYFILKPIYNYIIELFNNNNKLSYKNKNLIKISVNELLKLNKID
jgi:hypothetical protein